MTRHCEEATADEAIPNTMTEIASPCSAGLAMTGLFTDHSCH